MTLPQQPELHPHGDILVVDDTASSRQLLTELLRGVGYRVRQAPNGELALWSAAEQPPELILLDVRMPGLDGYEVCRRIKSIETLREVPVIFLSAYTDTDDKLKGFEAGGVDFISKPFQFEEVNARVAAHLKLGRLQLRLAWQNAHLQELVDAKVRQLTATELSLQGEQEQGEIARREARQRLTELAHMNRNASASVYCAALVHELRQPLAAILSNAEAGQLLLAKKPPELGELGAILSDIGRDNLRASDLISTMCELLRKSEPAFDEIELGAVVREVAALLAKEASLRAIALRLDAQASPMLVRGDRIQLQQVLVNLYLNAMDAIESGHGATRAISVRTESAAGFAYVSVSDSGCGFGANRDSAFASFFTTKPQGMGLGLSITAAIVGAHGGQISASDGLDGGAVVRFTLPLAPVPA
jgi:C4-dicarboxylate-specific signal transduction histidine kinase